MVNPLLILPLLNSSLSASANCWHQNPYGEPQLTPLHYRQCREAITEMNKDVAKDIHTPLTFGRSPDVGFEVPKTWDYANCHIMIDMVRPDVMETSNFATILERAVELNVACVNTPPFLGGEASVGDHSLIKLSIHGRNTGVLLNPLSMANMLTRKALQRNDAGGTIQLIPNATKSVGAFASLTHRSSAEKS